MMKTSGYFRKGVVATAVMVAIVVGTITGCSDSGGPDESEAQAYVGTWQLEVGEAAECWPAFTLRFLVEQNDADAASDGSMNVVSRWWEGTGPVPSGEPNPLTGNINWSANTFGILYHKIFGAGEFAGTAVTPDGLEGTFTDANGVFASLDPGKDGCTAPATADHVSDTAGG